MRLPATTPASAAFIGRALPPGPQAHALNRVAVWTRRGGVPGAWLPVNNAAHLSR